MRRVNAQTSNSEITCTQLNSTLPHLLNNHVISHTYDLFSDGSHISHYIQWDGSMIVNVELERRWAKAFLSWFEVLSQHLYRDTEKTQ
jgi:hypothetical protein